MNSKELTSLIGLNVIDERPRMKSTKNSTKGNRSGLDDFQDVDISNPNYDLRGSQKFKSKRQKSNDKKKARTKGTSFESLKPVSKVGTSTPE